jgi:putative sterol carrier protein
MSILFPSSEWLNVLKEKLNNDPRYHEIARKWEGDLIFDIQAAGNLAQSVTMYLDLWHGECRLVDYAPEPGKYDKPTFILRSPYTNFTSILLGKLDPMTAMMTSKLKVEGNLGYMMRNVPTVLDFVRCCREVTSDIL